jgi:hypothetical protein
MDFTEEELATVRALQMGSEEEACEALRRLRGYVPVDAVAERERFRDAVTTWKTGEGRDIADDPEAYAEAVRVDALIAEKHPDMSYADRLRVAGQVAREALGDPETRGNSEAIEAMRIQRGTPRDQREAAFKEASAIRSSRNQDSVDAEIEQARSEEIAAIAKERKGRVLEYGPPVRATPHENSR